MLLLTWWKTEQFESVEDFSTNLDVTNYFTNAVIPFTKILVYLALIWYTVTKLLFRFRRLRRRYICKVRNNSTRIAPSTATANTRVLPHQTIAVTRGGKAGYHVIVRTSATFWHIWSGWVYKSFVSLLFPHTSALSNRRNAYSANYLTQYWSLHNIYIYIWKKLLIHKIVFLCEKKK